MTAPASNSSFSLRDAPHETLVALIALGGIGGWLSLRLLERHLIVVTVTLGLLAGAVVVGCVARARLKDRAATKTDPSGPGIILGTVAGDWGLARRRPFYLPYSALPQHVLIDGPTGAGKTFTFVEPILHALLARPRTGMMYLDGKGDPIHRRTSRGKNSGAGFDAVFWPENPTGSAHWNPLAGAEPIAAAGHFAAALFPEAGQPAGNFYEARAVWAITTVMPAMSYSGHGVTDAKATVAAELLINGAELNAALRAAGLNADQAQRCTSNWPASAARQLAWLPYREDRSPDRLYEAARRAHTPPRDVPAELLGAEVYPVTPSDLHRMLFGPDELTDLRQKTSDRKHVAVEASHKATLTQLSENLDALIALPRKELAATLQNLQNRLAHFLQPPFLELCARSDFEVADITHGKRMCLLLPVGRFPTAAKPLGRVALAQFRAAVLASPTRTEKIAVLEEFHNFVSDDWAAFLNQARSRGGGAVMVTQSLADLPRDTREAMLANIRSVIVTPGASPSDAELWAETFGKERRERRSYTYQPRTALEPPAPPAVRIDETEDYRFTPTQISELEPGQALIRITDGRTRHPATIVDVERR